jgi:hypothetical protein
VRKKSEPKKRVGERPEAPRDEGGGAPLQAPLAEALGELCFASFFVSSDSDARSRP